MSFFRRKDPHAIPAVEQAPPPQRSQHESNRNELLGNSGGNSSSPRPPPRSNPSSQYVASRDGDYGNNNNQGSGYPDQRRGGYSDGNQGGQPPAQRAPPPRDMYQRNKPVGDVYSRGEGNADQARNELFSGYNAEKAGSGRFFDGPARGRTPPPGEETEEDVEGIKKQTRYVKQESVNSTRNALRLAREAEETARNTLGRLGDQSEKLANTERHLDVSKGHSQRADDRTSELKQLNKSIFRPVITFNKDKKRAAHDAKIQSRFEEERGAREKGMMDIRETQNRIGRAGTYGQDEDDEEGIGAGQRGAGNSADRQEQRKRFQFEKSASDDEMEDELDDNLDEISAMTKRLKALGGAMGQELDSQNRRIENIDRKTVGLDNRIHNNTERLKKL